ncbi:hypothetical protein ACFQ2B_11715 [Streptomyces stramineus]
MTGKETTYPASTDTVFDGAGRPTATIDRKFGDETKRTTTVYTGDTTTVIPPKGARRPLPSSTPAGTQWS